MVSNRLIALALMAALMQAWILSVRLSASTGEKAARAAPPPRLGEQWPQSTQLHCRNDLDQPWLLLDSAALLQAAPAPLP